MKRKLLLSLGLAASVFAPVSHAELPTLGKTYEIQEQSLLDVIMNRLKEKQANGEMEQLQKEMVERSKKNIERPRGISLPSTQNANIRFFDPTITVNNDIQLEDGRVLHPAGTKINPLDIRPFTKRFIFIDGDNEQQVEYAVSEHKKSGYRDKIILVRGSFGDLTRKHKIRFYFDQQMQTGQRGRRTLVQEFGVQNLPTLVYQEKFEDRHLIIEEVML